MRWRMSSISVLALRIRARMCGVGVSIELGGVIRCALHGLGREEVGGCGCGWEEEMGFGNGMGGS